MSESKPNPKSLSEEQLAAKHTTIDLAVRLDSLQQLKEQACNLFINANKRIQIYSHGLDPRILNNREIERHIAAFIKKSRNSELQILIYDENLLRGVDHRLIAIAQQFTSYVQIKVVPKDYQENPFGFYLADDRSMLYRSNCERYEAQFMKMPSFTIKDKSKLFNTIWQASTPASFLRALHL